MSLVESGGWGGNPTLIWQAPVDQVLMVFNYKNFIADYRETEMIMNEVNNG